MQNFAKLAGIQDASRHTQPRPSGRDQPAVPQPIDHDVESQDQSSLNRRPSRSSLPAVARRSSRRSVQSQPSDSSLRRTDEGRPPPIPSQYTAARDTPLSRASSTHGDNHDEYDDEDDDEDAQNGQDVPWGPQHPCFPHPNPHVPRESAEYQSTRIIRIQRDWLVAGDLYPAFANLYPEILVDEISEDEFRKLIERLNTMLEETFSPMRSRAMLDSVMGVLTGFLWDDAGLTGSKAGVKKIELFMDDWNAERRERGKMARLIPIRRTGFMCLDIQIPDPVVGKPEQGEGITRPQDAHL